jgi:hypothetical protein
MATRDGEALGTQASKNGSENLELNPPSLKNLVGHAASRLAWGRARRSLMGQGFRPPVRPPASIYVSTRTCSAAHAHAHMPSRQISDQPTCSRACPRTRASTARASARAPQDPTARVWISLNVPRKAGPTFASPPWPPAGRQVRRATQIGRGRQPGFIEN